MLIFMMKNQENHLFLAAQFWGTILTWFESWVDGENIHEVYLVFTELRLRVSLGKLSPKTLSFSKKDQQKHQLVFVYKCILQSP